MELVVCRCKKCRNTIGKFINLWIQIDKNGLVPIIESEDNLNIVYDGIIKHGERGTLNEGCERERIICAGCSALLGVKFLRTPANHVLHENQIRFCASSVTLSDDAGKQVNLAIKRVLTNKEPSRATAVNSTETQGESDNPHRRGVINIALSKNELASQPEASNEMTKVRDQVQQELTDLRAQVSDLQNQVNILTSKVNNGVSATNHANEVATPHAETADLRRPLSNTRSYNSTDRSFPSRELDILTSNIAKIGNRAAQVESLQMEFEIFKGRVERLETDRQAAERQEPTGLFEAEDPSPYFYKPPTSRKRTSLEAELPELDLAAKFHVVSAPPTLSSREHQHPTPRQSTSLEAAEPKGAPPQRGQSPQPSLPTESSKEREPSRGKRN